MKRNIPYLLGILLIVVILFILVRGGANKEHKKEISTVITLKKEDKNPYGTYVFYNGLKQFYPKAKVVRNSKRISLNKVLNDNKIHQLFVSVVPQFNPSSYELEELMTFIEKGNNVLISAIQINKDMEDFIEVQCGFGNLSSYPFADYGPDTMRQELEKPPFPQELTLNYPGASMEGFFSKTNSSTTTIIGRGDKGKANFIALRKGEGSLFLHLSPLSFSNYFLLYRDNIYYFNRVMSLLPADTPVIIWDEYYRNRKKEGGGPDWFTTIMKERSFRTGILLALLLIVIFTLLEMRRRQKLIPVIEPPKNDSLEFVKTMGLLYYEKKDNTNLAQKMGAYFSEHLRNKFKIFSKELNNEFIKEVSDKSGVHTELVRAIVNQIKQVQAENYISDEDLIILQRNIETFYNHS